MPVLTQAQFLEQSPAYEAALAASDVVDPFCSSPAWIESALLAFAPTPTPLVVQSDGGWAPLAVRAGAVRWVAPWESSWGLASAIVGPDPARLCPDVVEALLLRRADWDVLYLSGLGRQSVAFLTLARLLHRSLRLGVSAPTVRCVASLDGGADAFLARRTPKFRKALRAQLRAAGGQILMEHEAPNTAAHALRAFGSLQEIERISWKGREGLGITEGPMHRFYAEMMPRLAERGQLRLTWAVQDGQRVGYVLGGVLGQTYRGLQFSFDASLAVLSVGNLMQWATIQALCAEGVRQYDLGTEMEYKLRWSEQLHETVALVAR